MRNPINLAIILIVLCFVFVPLTAQTTNPVFLATQAQFASLVLPLWIVIVILAIIIMVLGMRD